MRGPIPLALLALLSGSACGSSAPTKSSETMSPAGGESSQGGSAVGGTSGGSVTTGGSLSTSSGGAAGSGGSGGTGSGGGAGQAGGGSSGGAGAPGAGAVPGIIFDTDMGPDIDDAGALAVLHALTDNGEANLLAVVISTSDGTGSRAIGFIDQVNTYYNRPDLPIGIWKGGSFGGGVTFTTTVFENTAFPRDLDDSQDSVPDATDLYRQVLAEQPDGSVVIVCVGFTNNLKKLLESGPDSASNLDGSALIAAKVALLSDMGGAYPSGNEFNFYTQPAAGTTQAVVENWPTPVVFSGFEIGVGIMTTPTADDTSEDSPVLAAYLAHSGGSNRSSWDLTSVLYAVRGAGTFWDLETVGSNQVMADGSNAWQSSPDLEHSYLQAKADNSEVANVLNALIAKAPGVKE